MTGEERARIFNELYDDIMHRSVPVAFAAVLDKLVDIEARLQRLEKKESS